MASTPNFIPADEAAYIDLLLRDLDSSSRKSGLQRLCGLYRQGRILPNPAPVRTFLIGLLNDESDKVRRWALNALALIGSSRDAPPILKSIEDFRDSPDLLGAAVSALSVLLPPMEFTASLKHNGLPLEGSILLAAAQQNGRFVPMLRKHRIDMDRALPVELRMATILVGLNKAPFRLFSPKHSNSAMVGVLNRHDDPIVAQYSVWAIVENPDMGFANLLLPLRDIEAQPANVRGWVHRLIASDPGTAAANLDFIQLASRDSSVAAREGLADGLRDVAFPDVDRIVVNWFTSEANDGVRQRLLEHMARNADRFERYPEAVVGIYRAASRGSLIRARLESAARGTALHQTLKIIDHDAERADLFGVTTMKSSPPRTAAASLARDGQLPDPKEVRVLIVVALPKELAAVMATMSSFERIGVAGDANVYAVGHFVDDKGRPRAVLVCQSGMGNDNAAVTATDALRSFPKLEHVVMTGIAGGCPNPTRADEHVRLGDVVFSNDAGILEYDFVKEDASGRSLRSHPQKPSARMLATIAAIQAEELIGRRPWEAEIDRIVETNRAFARPEDDTDILHDDGGKPIDHPKGSERNGRPRLHGGGIGTADTLQKNPSARDSLRDEFKVKAIEMEAGGMHSAAWAHDRSVMVVRGVCDYCDAQKNDIWQMHASAVAAAFTKTLVLGMPEEWFPSTS